MSIRSTLQRLPFGMGTVAAVGAVALAVTAGIVLMPGHSVSADDAAHGVLEEYDTTPTVQWTLDDASLPGLTGDGDITIADTHRGDWLVSYTAGIRREYVLVDADTGALRWDAPVTVGFGACAFDSRGQVGCSVRTRTDGPDNGFYLVSRSGALDRRADGSDTSALVGVGSDFVHVNSTRYQVSRRSVDGHVKWSRTFAAAATPRYSDGVLVVETADGAAFVLDPITGDDIVTCASCTVEAFSTGVLVSHTPFSNASVDFHPVVDGRVSADSVHTARSQVIVDGPSTLPVLTAGGDQSLESHGRYQVVDPATGHARWQVDDPDLSKVHARPCGPLVSFARKDRSRVFATLASGDIVGQLPPPALDDPSADIDKLACVGASDDVVVFTDRSQLTAYRASTGAQVWTYPINGDASDVDGRIALLQGSTLSVLAP
ncbi:hypothetical protein nbrc107696_16850 [Gordonia spumicola]|uniref:Pyrrolo-quinoline quinone repeat domain-containing protein n=1 Tax=Gordonia spumicola TaxID=589161 RepID=A0A7I9V762_9ACTN|nr:PQQ-binding-like beta-propeller repeat protein [Gordonia spumicola]GEE01239.1 hypothetical protein nbrc107696_16850 [Gordonia spumicola]